MQAKVGETWPFSKQENEQREKAEMGLVWEREHSLFYSQNKLRGLENWEMGKKVFLVIA